MEMLLQHMQYSDWNICGDMGLQLGYSKYCYFICEWDSHAHESHYCRQSCPLHKMLVSEKKMWHMTRLSTSKDISDSSSLKIGTCS